MLLLTPNISTSYASELENIDVNTLKNIISSLTEGMSEGIKDYDTSPVLSYAEAKDAEGNVYSDILISITVSFVRNGDLYLGNGAVMINISPMVKMMEDIVASREQ